MKFLQIDKYHKSKTIYAITILGLRIDWRRWYQFWLEKGDDPIDKELEGWCGVWLTLGELEHDLWHDRVFDEYSADAFDFEDVKRDVPHDWKYRKIPLILTIINWRSWWYKNKKLLAGILIGFLLSLLIQY